MEAMQADFGSLIVMIVSIIALVLMITKLKIHPVFTLVIVATVSAIGFGFPLNEVFNTVTGGFGGTIGSIGIVIILGTAIGVILEETGGALVLANSILKVVGKSNSRLAMGLAGYLVSIPVFSDSAIVIMSPVAKALSARSGLPLIGLLGALNAGIMATHTMVPPTPGPLAAAGTLGADLGMVIILGLISSLAYTFAAMYYTGHKSVVSRWPEVAKVENVEAAMGDDFELKSPDGRPLPSAVLAFGSIVVPLILICVNSFGAMFIEEGAPILDIFGFIGHPIFALFVGVIIAIFMTNEFSLDKMYSWADTAVESSGFIILATGAAGAFGRVLQTSGVGTYLGELITQTGLPAIFVPYLVAVLLSVSNGSATVSLLTGSAIILPLLPSLGLSPVMATLAVAAGSSFFYHTNASHFWVVVRANDLPMKEGFDVCSIPTAIGSVAAFIVVWGMSIVLPF